MKRRSFLATSTAATGALLAKTTPEPAPERRIRFAVKDSMCHGEQSLFEKFTSLKALGYDGVEFHAPAGTKVKEAATASRKSGLPIHGVVNQLHWKTKLSSSSEEERASAVETLKTCLSEAHSLGASSVLLVPGVAKGDTTQQQAWDRSIAGIRKALPLAAKLGVHILIENVWNNMFYDPKGPNTQSADLLANYLDEMNSPWVGSYFDIGNHQRFGNPAAWIRTLGRRIVKLDVKDWGLADGFGKIGDGDVDWPAVRAALREIGYTGWATAEVRGGDLDRLSEILKNMRTHLLGI